MKIVWDIYRDFFYVASHLSNKQKIAPCEGAARGFSNRDPKSEELSSRVVSMRALLLCRGPYFEPALATNKKHCSLAVYRESHSHAKNIHQQTPPSDTEETRNLVCREADDNAANRLFCFSER